MRDKKQLGTGENTNRFRAAAGVKLTSKYNVTRNGQSQGYAEKRRA